MDCKVKGCERPSKTKELCGSHYQRLRRYGNPEQGGPLPEYKPRKGGLQPGQVIGELTLIRKVEAGNRWECNCACGKVRTVPRESLTVGRIKTCGDYRVHWLGESHPNWGDDLTYSGAHQRVGRIKGLAKGFDCVDCGGSAQEWSYTGDSPDEQENDEGLTYSVDPDYYEPRCVACHRAYDANKRGDQQ